MWLWQSWQSLPSLPFYPIPSAVLNHWIKLLKLATQVTLLLSYTQFLLLKLTTKVPIKVKHLILTQGCPFSYGHICVLSIQRQSFAPPGQIPLPLSFVPFPSPYQGILAHPNTDLPFFSS